MALLHLLNLTKLLGQNGQTTASVIPRNGNATNFVARFFPSHIFFCCPRTLFLSFPLLLPSVLRSTWSGVEGVFFFALI